MKHREHRGCGIDSKNRRPAAYWSESRPYSETVLFTALPSLCISSPMPRTVAHPSEVKTTKSSAQRSNLFFFIFYLLWSIEQQACQCCKTAVNKASFSHCLLMSAFGRESDERMLYVFLYIFRKQLNSHLPNRNDRKVNFFVV
jgi:hypothetical protein